MTDKELKKLNRRELLEILVLQTRKTEALEKKLAALQARLDEKELKVEKAGDLARAVMELNGVFDDAKKAAEQYEENVRRMEEACRKSCEEQQAQARAQAEAIVAQARAEADAILKNAKK